MTLTEAVAVAKKLPAVDPQVVVDAQTILAIGAPEVAAQFPKSVSQNGTDVLSFLPKLTPQLLTGWDAAIVFLTSLEGGTSVIMNPVSPNQILCSGLCRPFRRRHPLASMPADWQKMLPAFSLRRLVLRQPQRGLIFRRRSCRTAEFLAYIVSECCEHPQNPFVRCGALHFASWFPVLRTDQRQENAGGH